jgi:hypothetical protein
VTHRSRRRPAGGLVIHEVPVAHTDAGSQYTSVAYTERIADLGMEPSIGTVGDALDSVMAEAWVGTIKSELTASSPTCSWRVASWIAAPCTRTRSAARVSPRWSWGSRCCGLRIGTTPRGGSTASPCDVSASRTHPIGRSTHDVPRSRPGCASARPRSRSCLASRSSALVRSSRASGASMPCFRRPSTNSPRCRASDLSGRGRWRRPSTTRLQLRRPPRRPPPPALSR